MMNVTRTATTQDQHAAVATLRRHLYGFMAAPVLYAALVLEIPELLATTPATTAEIADQAHIAATRVQALMAGLVALDVVERDADHRYHLTALGDLLRPTGSTSLTDEILFTCQAMYPAFGALAGGLLADAVPFDLAFRRDFSAYLGRHPAMARAFGRYISSLTERIAREILVTYDFSAYKRLVDVGGGIGTLAAAITTRYPQCQAVVLDQAAMQPEAERFLAAQGVTERCCFVAGDFYGEIPPGDLLVLCQVLHDLSDTQCQQVLRRCYESLAPNGRLLVLEMLADSEAPALPVVWRNLKMVVMSNGLERSHAEWLALLRDAGFTVTRVLPLTTSAHTGDRPPQMYGIEVCRADSKGVPLALLRAD